MKLHRKTWVKLQQIYQIIKTTPLVSIDDYDRIIKSCIKIAKKAKIEDEIILENIPTIDIYYDVDLIGFFTYGGREKLLGFWRIIANRITRTD